MSSTQIFLEMLESTPGIYHRVHRSLEGRINAVFFSFEWALQQWQENQEILSFDSVTGAIETFFTKSNGTIISKFLAKEKRGNKEELK